jgi:DNA-binding LacI/PurR family transcriptional regulator
MAARHKVTINDVARAAGVSRQTVSNVLNDSGRVGAAARARVLEVVAELGYQPHHGARSLRSRRTMQLGYLMPGLGFQPADLITMQFLQALVAAGARRRYRVVVAHQGADPRDEIRGLMASGSVDAFVLSDPKRADSRVALLSDLAVPFACFGRTGAGVPQHWADIDNAEAVAAVVAHVLGQGFANPGYVGYRSGTYPDIERENGFRTGLARHGITGTGLLQVDDSPGARARIRRFLSSARPDAVVTGSDEIAAVVYGVAAELNLRVGRDLAVTGFGGSIGAGLLYPRLTTVVIPVADLAERIVGRVLRQLEHGPDTEPGEIVPASLRPAASTPPRPAAGGLGRRPGRDLSMEPRAQGAGRPAGVRADHGAAAGDGRRCPARAGTMIVAAAVPSSVAVRPSTWQRSSP